MEVNCEYLKTLHLWDGVIKYFGRYVATDGGIVEYHVDIAGRKVFPSFTPR